MLLFFILPSLLFIIIIIVIILFFRSGSRYSLAVTALWLWCHMAERSFCSSTLVILLGRHHLVPVLPTSTEAPSLFHDCVSSLRGCILLGSGWGLVESGEEDKGDRDRCVRQLVPTAHLFALFLRTLTFYLTKAHFVILHSSWLCICVCPNVTMHDTPI